ncbi:hypothetical protein ACNKHU_19180 [Shigella flexneri]
MKAVNAARIAMRRTSAHMFAR